MDLKVHCNPRLVITMLMKAQAAISVRKTNQVKYIDVIYISEVNHKRKIQIASVP